MANHGTRKYTVRAPRNKYPCRSLDVSLQSVRAKLVMSAIKFVTALGKILRDLQTKARNLKLEPLLTQTGKHCFDLLAALCVRPQLVRFTKVPSGKYVLASSRRHRLAHNFVLAASWSSIAHQLTVCISRLVLNELDIPTLICISSFLIHFVPLCASVGIIRRAQETADLLNAWPQILSCLDETGSTGRKERQSQFARVSVCLKIIALTGFTTIAAFSAAVWSIAFKDLPVFLLPLARKLGIVPDVKPRILWQLIFFPIQLVAAVLPLGAGCFTVAIIIMSLETFSVYMDELA